MHHNRAPLLLPQVFGPHIKRYLAKDLIYEAPKQNNHHRDRIEGNKDCPEPELINPIKLKLPTPYLQLINPKKEPKQQNRKDPYC